MTSLKRGYTKVGQSEYYYLDPRGAETFSDMKTIDVESEDTPNPKIKAILNDDLHKNPQDDYIWRTKGDEAQLLSTITFRINVQVLFTK